MDVEAVIYSALTEIDPSIPHTPETPLFGPDSVSINRGLNGLKIVVCFPGGKKSKKIEMMLKLFKDLRLKVIVATPGEHDKQMANSQALVHLIGRGLASLKMKPQEISTPDYDSLVRIHSMVNNDTMQLFSDMQTKNPFAKRVRRKFIGSLVHIDAKLNQQMK